MAVLCIILTTHAGIYRDHTRTAKRLSTRSPRAGRVLTRRRLHPVLPLNSCSQRSIIKTWTDRCLGWRPTQSPQLTIHTGHRLMPPHPPSGSWSINTHVAKHLTPSPSVPLVMLQSVTQGTKTPVMGLCLSTAKTQASSRLHTPDWCELCHLNQDQSTFCP